MLHTFPPPVVMPKGGQRASPGLYCIGGHSGRREERSDWDLLSRCTVLVAAGRHLTKALPSFASLNLTKAPPYLDPPCKALT